MSTSQKLQEFEKKAGLTLLSEHTYKESENHIWHLRICVTEFSGRKNWVMWCEKKGVEVTGTRQTGFNITKGLKEIFSIN